MVVRGGAGVMMQDTPVTSRTVTDTEPDLVTRVLTAITRYRNQYAEYPAYLRLGNDEWWECIEIGRRNGLCDAFFDPRQLQLLGLRVERELLAKSYLEVRGEEGEIAQ